MWQYIVAQKRNGRISLQSHAHFCFARAPAGADKDHAFFVLFLSDARRPAAGRMHVRAGAIPDYGSPLGAIQQALQIIRLSSEAADRAASTQSTGVTWTQFQATFLGGGAPAPALPNAAQDPASRPRNGPPGLPWAIGDTKGAGQARRTL